jgi:hypothetical protein
LTFTGRVSPVDEAELGQATVDLQQAQSRYDVMADRSDVGMRPEAEALQQATLAYARAKAAYDRAVEQVGQHTYDVRSQQKRVALARLQVERLETGVDPRLEQSVAKAELDLADLQAQITDTLVLAQAEQGRSLPLTELTAAFPRCLGDILLAICERGEDVTMVLRTASDE